MILPGEWVSVEEKKKLFSVILEKLRDRNYLSTILSKISGTEIESEESIRQKQIINRENFKKKFNMK